MLHIPARLRRYVSPMVQAGPAQDSWHKFPLRDVSSMVGSRSVLIVAPHPDDESLGCGGLIADCQARGQPIYVLILTDGSGSHPHSRAWPPDKLAVLRANETRQAMQTLGVPKDHVGFIGLPDSRAPLRGARLRSTAQLIAEYARQRDVGTICTTWPGDPHHDHLAAYRIAALAAPQAGTRLFCYPVWGWMLPRTAWVEPTPNQGVRIDIARHLDAKQRAIACHRSQATDLIDDDPSAFRMSREFLANFRRPYEVFIDVANGLETAADA